MKNQNLNSIQPKNQIVSLFRNITNKLFKHRRNAEKLTVWHLGKKADSPRNFSGKFSNLVGILLWIIVILNLIITFLIYKIIF
jgi:hypothetical protein